MFLLTDYYSSYEYSTTDPEASGAILAVYMGLIFFLLIYAFLNAIVTSLLFRKAGKELWWGGFIPFFSSYLYITTAFKQKYWPVMFIPFGILLLSFIPFIGILISFTGIAFLYYLNYNFAKSFGVSTIQAVLYLFFPFIMGVIFLLDKNITYQGPRPFLDEKEDKVIINQ